MKCSTLVITTLMLALSSCKTVQPQGAETKDLAFESKDARNVAAFFTAPNPVGNSPVYITNDPETIIEGLTGLDQNFRTYKNEGATRAVVSDWVKTFVGPDYLSDNGTLMLYIAGHGAPTAQAQMQDGSFVSFDDIAAAIKAGRPGKPLKRLVLMVFGCYSGSWINTVKARDLTGVTEQLFVITSSTSNQLSYSGGYNSDLVRAFNTALGTYNGGSGTVTLGSFAADIQRYVTSSTPQYWSKPASLQQETLFNAEIVSLFSLAAEKGIMPTPEEFGQGRRSPSRKTIETNMEVEADAQNHCDFAIVKNSANVELCAAWNQNDRDANANVAAYVRARAVGSASRCDAPLIYTTLDATKFAALHDHCKGFLKPKLD